MTEAERALREGLKTLSVPLSPSQWFACVEDLWAWEDNATRSLRSILTSEYGNVKEKFGLVRQALFNQSESGEQIAWALIQNCPDVILVTSDAQGWKTLLHMSIALASDKLSMDILDLATKQKIPLTNVLKEERGEKTPLHMAAEKENLPLVRKILECDETLVVDEKLISKAISSRWYDQLQIFIQLRPRSISRDLIRHAVISSQSELLSTISSKAPDQFKDQALLHYAIRETSFEDELLLPGTVEILLRDYPGVALEFDEAENPALHYLPSIKNAQVREHVRDTIAAQIVRLASPLTQSKSHHRAEDGRYKVGEHIRKLLADPSGM